MMVKDTKERPGKMVMAFRISLRTKKLVGKISLWLFLLSLSLPLIAQPSAEDPGSKLDAYLEIQTKLGRFSGVVLISQNGKIIFEKAYGLANYELNAPLRVRSKFRIGSLTKSFTAAAILQLAEKGALRLEDPLARFFPDYPNGEKITIHHLLTHTSGIPNFTSLPEYAKFKLNPATLSQTISLFRQLPLQFEPGTKFAYSNSGYILLTAIIEKVAGKTYADYLRENIFLPLNMLDTSYDDLNAVIKYRALGYSLKDGEMVNAPYIDMSVPAGAGGLLSTVEDLFAWDQALRTDRLLSSSSREKMFTPFLQNYGYGWEITEVDGKKIAQHSGGIEGFVSHFTRFLTEDACLIILSNFDFAPLSQVKQDLMAIRAGKPIVWPRERKAIHLAPEIFDRYCGDYEIAPNLILHVSRENNRFWAQVAGQRRIEILPESETRFFGRFIEAEAVFILDQEGKVSELVIYQAGKETRARKIK